MLVVADTSPLNYLIWIDCVETLQQLYRSVLIPYEVPCSCPVLGD